jgi:hypothetical protein
MTKLVVWKAMKWEMSSSTREFLLTKHISLLPCCLGTTSDVSRRIFRGWSRGKKIGKRSYSESDCHGNIFIYASNPRNRQTENTGDMF